MDGLGCLGVEEAVGADAAAASKEVAGKTLSAIADVISKKDDKKLDQPKTDKGVDSGPSWFVRPAVGPVPGWGVLAAIGAALGGGWWYFKK